MIEYQNIGAVVVTAKNSGAEAGQVCKYESNDTVAACAVGDPVHGVCVYGNDSYASVQVKGFITLPYTGSTAPTLGFCQLTANGTGGVQSASAGPQRLVTAVDTTGKTVTFCL